MPKILPYSAMSVSLINSTSNPTASVAIAASITMKSNPEEIPKPASSKFCKNIVLAGHGSILEHVQMTFLCENISRSLLAQITRQRTAHPTSGSQHYQDYSDYPMMISPNQFDKKHIADYKIGQAFDMCIESYKCQLADGVPKEDARQVLPNACGVNYKFTIDAFNLFKFLKTRLCNRNVLEMRIFAERIKQEAVEYFPELFSHVEPNCRLTECKDIALGMQCKEKFWKSVWPSIQYSGKPISTEELSISSDLPIDCLKNLVNRNKPALTIGLSSILDRVRHLQGVMGYKYGHMSQEFRMEMLLKHHSALIIELSEFMRELPWKPWRPIETQKHAPKDRIAEEFVDCLIFLVNMSLCVDLSSDDIVSAFERVMASNYNRIQEKVVKINS